MEPLTLDSEGDAFQVAKRRLEEVLQGACRSGHCWPERVAGAIWEGLRFAESHPRLARTLTVDATMRRMDGGRAYLGLIDSLAGMLDRGAPSFGGPLVVDRHAVVAQILRHVGNEIDRSARRPTAIAPDLVQFALVPFVGYQESKHWASVVSSAAPDGSEGNGMSQSVA